MSKNENQVTASPQIANAGSQGSRPKKPSLHDDNQSVYSPSSIKKVLQLGKMRDRDNIQMKNLSSEMMRIIRRYLRMASSEWETQFIHNNSLIMKKKRSQEPPLVGSPQNQMNQPYQNTPVLKSFSSSQRFQQKEKIDQSIKNYELLRDPRFWIQRSLSEQINHIKGLNSDLVDYRFKDEDIRSSQERSQVVGIELRKIVPSRLYNNNKNNFNNNNNSININNNGIENENSQRQQEIQQNDLQDQISLANDQWLASRLNLKSENPKDEEISEKQRYSGKHGVNRYSNQLQSSAYNKSLKTESFIQLQRRMLPKNLSLTKRQIDDKLQEIYKQEEQLKMHQKLVRHQSGNLHISDKSKVNYFEDDNHNFILPSSGNQSNSVSNNPTISPFQQKQQGLRQKQQPNISLRRVYTQFGSQSVQQLTPQQMMYFNSSNVGNMNNSINSPLEIKRNSKGNSLNSYQVVQQSLINEKSRFSYENVQLAPISKGLSFQQQLQNKNGQLMSNKPILRITTESIGQTAVQEQILGYKMHQHYEDLEELASDVDLNDLFKQDEAGMFLNFSNLNNNNLINIIDQKKTLLEPTKVIKIQDKGQKDYKIRKFQMKKEDPIINALGKSYSVYFEQQFVNRIQKEKQFSLRISAYRDFLQAMNFTNKLYVSISEEKQQNHPIYKAFVGKGNNQMLIRMVIKQRWWWIITDQRDDSNINLVWTQLKKSDVLSTIKNLKQEILATRLQRQLSSTSIQQVQQSPQNSICYQNQSQPLSLSPSNSSASFSYAQTTNQQQQNQSISTQSLFGSQSESTTDESTIISSSNLNLQLLPKQIVKLNKQEQQLRKLTNTSDFQALNGLLQNRKGKKFDSQAFTSPSSTNNLLKDQECKVLKDPTQLRIHNHLQDNFHLSNKKALFYNMRSYYESNQQNPFDFIPLTFHIQEGKKDKEYSKFVNHYNSLKELQNNYNTTQGAQQGANPVAPTVKKEQNIWIVKPGEITNRGSGIKVLSDLDQIEQIIDSNEFHKSGMRKTYIIQKYIEYPLLYYKRKFDIRCYYLLTSTNGYLKGYWYQEGYIRTASKEFTTKNLGKMIHLTNDAVQKKDDQYGKYEKGNKVSYDELDKYLGSLYPEKDFYNLILPQMKEIGRDTMKAVYGKIDPDKKESTMEVFGLDFMIDDNLRVWLIEVNTNPALDICCPLLSRIIPPMIENTFRIAIDPLFPPPTFSNHKTFNIDNLLENNKYELIFDEDEDSKVIKMIGKDTNLNWQMIEEELDEDEEEIIPE